MASPSAPNEVPGAAEERSDKSASTSMTASDQQAANVGVQQEESKSQQQAGGPLDDKPQGERIDFSADLHPLSAAAENALLTAHDGMPHMSVPPAETGNSVP